MGRLIIASNLPGVANPVASSLKQGEKDLYDCEQELLGTNHAELGAYLLAEWGLPHAILQAIGFHHNPQPFASTAFIPLTSGLLYSKLSVFVSPRYSKVTVFGVMLTSLTP